MRSLLSLLSCHARDRIARLASLGAAGFAAALVVAPMAHADAPPTPPSTDTGTPPNDPAPPADVLTPSDTTAPAVPTTTATPTDPASPAGTPAPDETPTPADTPTPVDTPTAGVMPTPVPTASVPAASVPAATPAAGPAKRAAKAVPAVVAPAAVAPNFGSQKLFVGVQLKTGGYYPAGTTTVGSQITIVETGLGVVGTRTTTCTTFADGTAGGSECFNFPFGYLVAPGDTAVVSQIEPAQPGVLIDPVSQTVVPCVNPVAIAVAPAAVDQADPPVCNGFTFLDFTDPGLPPLAVHDVSTVQAGHSVQIQVQANDETNGAPTTISAVTNPAHGTTVIAGNHITYTPDAGFFGADAFTYTITTPNGSSTASVALTVTAPPIAVNDTASTVGGTGSAAGQAVGVAVLANDRAQGGTLALTAAGAAGHGTAAISGTTIVYTPAAGFTGTDSFTYTISNGHGTSTATVTVTVTAPLLVEAAGTGGLASTGTPSEQLLGTGSVLVLAGGGLVLAGGRRRRGNA